MSRIRALVIQPSYWLFALVSLASAIFVANLILMPGIAHAQAKALPAPNSCLHGSITDYKESLAALKAKVIVLEGADFEAFANDLDILLSMGPAPAVIQGIGFTDP